MHDRELLDTFGSEFAREARDLTIRRLRAIIEGSVQSSRGRQLHEEIAALTSDDAVKAEHLTRAFIDETLHNVLWMFERSETFDIVARMRDGPAVSVRDASDGLAGELHSGDGWLARFSSFGGEV